jgi:large subunit ribosomal protein L31e
MERTYIIPLRREWLKVPIYKRTKKAVNTTRAFLVKHMKVETVKLGRHLNMKLWTRGNRNPPHKVEVHVEIVKDKAGDYAYAELVGKDKEVLKVEKVVKKTGIAGKLEELTKGKDKPNPKAEKQKAAEEEVKKEVLKEKPAKKEAAKVAPEQKDKTTEQEEKVRRENLVNKDNKQEHKKK